MNEPGASLPPIGCAGLFTYTVGEIGSTNMNQLEPRAEKVGAHVGFHLGQHAKGNSFTVDGVDLTTKIGQKVVIELDSQGSPVVTVRLHALDVKAALDGATVQVDDETAAALAALGWEKVK